MSRRHDQSYKLLFSLPLAIKHLIRGFINSDLADELDFDRMESLATERTTPGLVRSQADLMWKIHFKGSSRVLLLPIEFQSRTDRYMAARMLYYVGVAFDGLLAGKTRSHQLAPGGLLPPALAVTIYNGRDRWTAADDVRDLIEPARGWLADHQPKLIHKALDLRALTGQPLPERNGRVVDCQDGGGFLGAECIASGEGGARHLPGTRTQATAGGISGVGPGSSAVVGDRRRGYETSGIAEGGGNGLRRRRGAEGDGAPRGTRHAGLPPG